MSIINRLFGGDKEMAAKVAEYIRHELAAHEAELAAPDQTDAEPEFAPDESVLQAQQAREWEQRQRAAQRATIESQGFTFTN